MGLQGVSKSLIILNKVPLEVLNESNSSSEEGSVDGLMNPAVIVNKWAEDRPLHALVIGRIF